MHLTVRNLTDDPITAHTYPTPHKFNLLQHKKGVAQSAYGFTLQPSTDFSTTLVKGFRREIILRRTYQPDVAEPAATPGIEELLLEKDWHIHPEGFKIRFSMTLSASWQVVPVPVGCPWRVFTSRISRGHHKLVILSRRNLASFLSELPNRLPLSSLSLPGTHDTMAFYGWPVSQCQTVPLSTQLNGGIRVLDIRLAVIPPPSPKEPPLTKDQQLIAYHGLWPQQTPFLAILNDVHTFLTSPIGCMETIIMSIKQEDFAVTPTPLFSQLVRETIVQGPGGWDDSQLSDSGVNRGMWFLENRIPTLGEVRGKVVMLSRFGGNGAGWEGGLEGLGIHPTTWPDSDQEGFEWELKGTRVRTHDWYNIPSFFKIPDKVERASANLIPPADSPGPVLPVTFFSAASFPFALPPTVAKGFGWPKWGLGIEGVNSRLGKWLLDQLGGETQSGTAMTDVEKGKVAALSEQKEPRIRGWTFLDYYSEPEGGEIIPLLVECNFRGRKEGEEGW